MRRVEQCVKQKVGNCCENTSPKCPDIFSCFIVPHSLPRLHKIAVRFGFYSQGHTTVMATVPVPKKKTLQKLKDFLFYTKAVRQSVTTAVTFVPRRPRSAIRARAHRPRMGRGRRERCRLGSRLTTGRCTRERRETARASAGRGRPRRA